MSLFGGMGQTQANQGMRAGYWNPYNIGGSWGGITQTPGYIPTGKEWKKGMRPTGGSYGMTLSPEMEAARSGFLGNAMGAMNQGNQSAGGFAGITPEMFQEFMKANHGQGQNWMNQAQGYLNEEKAMGPFDFQGTYDSRLANMRALDAPMEERGRQGSLDNQFGKGILASTAGSYQTEGLERALAAKDIMRHDSAFGQAMGREQQNMMQRQMLQSGAMNFGQSGHNQVQDRFARAMGLFGAGNQMQNDAMGRATGYMSNVGNMDQFMANLMQLSGNLGSQQSGANTQAYAPAVSAAMNSGMMNADFFGQLAGGAMGGMSFGGPAGFGFNI